MTSLTYLTKFQRQNGEVSEILDEDEAWDPDQPSSEDTKPQLWITDSKSNVKYAITQLNYSQVNNCNNIKLLRARSRFILFFLIKAYLVKSFAA